MSGTLQLEKTRGGLVGLGVNPHKDSWGDNLDAVIVATSSGDIKDSAFSITGSLGYWDGYFVEVEKSDFIVMVNEESQLVIVEILDIDKESNLATVNVTKDNFPSFLKGAVAKFWKYTKGYMVKYDYLHGIE